MRRGRTLSDQFASPCIEHCKRSVYIWYKFSPCNKLKYLGICQTENIFLLGLCFTSHFTNAKNISGIPSGPPEMPRKLLTKQHPKVLNNQSNRRLKTHGTVVCNSSHMVMNNAARWIHWCLDGSFQNCLQWHRTASKINYLMLQKCNNYAKFCT